MKIFRYLLQVVVFCCFLFTFILPSFAAEEIRWGVSSSFQHELGIAVKNACLMATEEINDAGGIFGRKVVPFFADDEAKPEVGIRAVKKLIYEDKVDFLSGGWLSGVALAQADHIFDAKKLWLAGGPYSPKLSELVKNNYERAKYFFRCATLDSNSQSEEMGRFAVGFWKEKFGFTKLAFLPESSVWAREMADIMKKELPKNGIEIVYEDIFDPERSDFSPQFAKIKASGAQYIFHIQAVSTGIAMTKQWTDTGLPIQMSGFNDVATAWNYWDKTGGKCLWEMHQILNGGRAPITPTTIPFFDKYVNKYNVSPTYTASAQYDALYLFKHVVEKTKSLDTDTLIKALEGIEYRGVQGPVRFTKYHDTVCGKGGLESTWIQWRGPRKMEIIYPFQYATTQFSFAPWVTVRK